jgi:hypothetical protein
MAGLVEPAGASGDVGHCALTRHWFIREENFVPYFLANDPCGRPDFCGAQTVPVDHRDLIMMVTWEFAE